MTPETAQNKIKETRELDRLLNKIHWLKTTIELVSKPGQREMLQSITFGFSDGTQHMHLDLSPGRYARLADHALPLLKDELRGLESQLALMP